jgi:hypothetical protein
MALLDFSYFEADKYSFNIGRLGFITEILGEFPGALEIHMRAHLKPPFARAVKRSELTPI